MLASPKQLRLMISKYISAYFIIQDWLLLFVYFLTYTSLNSMWNDTKY